MTTPDQPASQIEQPTADLLKQKKQKKRKISLLDITKLLHESIEFDWQLDEDHDIQLGAEARVQNVLLPWTLSWQRLPMPRNGSKCGRNIKESSFPAGRIIRRY